MHVIATYVEQHDLLATKKFKKSLQLSTPERSRGESRNSLEICSKCFQEIGKGLRHPRSTPVRARENMLQLVEKLPEKQKEQIASNIVRQKLETLSDISNK